MHYRFITIEGNIGAGKTTLARMLAEHYGASLMLERFEDNTFLPKFYADPERYAFPLELSFLAERYQQLRMVSQGSDLFRPMTISDYFLSKSLIFASVNLGEEEYKLFGQLFHIMFQSIPKPDLLVYLYVSAETLKKNIHRRGRDYEQDIQIEYLDQVQAKYLDFLRKQSDQMRILILDTENADFVAEKRHFVEIIDKIENQRSKGLFYENLNADNSGS